MNVRTLSSLSSVLSNSRYSILNKIHNISDFSALGQSMHFIFTCVVLYLLNFCQKAPRFSSLYRAERRMHYYLLQSLHFESVFLFQEFCLIFLILIRRFHVDRANAGSLLVISHFELKLAFLSIPVYFRFVEIGC